MPLWDENKMKRTKALNLAFAAAMLFGMALSLSACNTVEGLGEDISASARTVKKAL